MSEEKQEMDTTPGIISWAELCTPNKSASIEFYSKLFGWTTEDMDMPNGDTYTMFKLGDRTLAGCVQPEGEAIPMWLNYVNVDDVDAAISKAVELGASVILERVDIPMGSFAVITDPVGAAIAFWQGTGECGS